MELKPKGYHQNSKEHGKHNHPHEKYIQDQKKNETEYYKDISRKEFSIFPTI